MSTTEYLLVIGIHAALLGGLAHYYAKRYRKAVQASNRRIKELVTQNEISELKEELVFLRKRNDILLRGFIPRGDVFPGNFIEEDPELQALSELLSILSQSGSKSQHSALPVAKELSQESSTL